MDGTARGRGEEFPRQHACSAVDQRQPLEQHGREQSHERKVVLYFDIRIFGPQPMAWTNNPAAFLTVVVCCGAPWSMAPGAVWRSRCTPMETRF